MTDPIAESGELAPNGWQLVPIEPDLTQQNAGWTEVDKQGFATEDTEVAPIYRAMLAAAPAPPPSPDTRSEALEEAARVADAYAHRDTGREIAAAIRALSKGGSDD